VRNPPKEEGAAEPTYSELTATPIPQPPMPLREKEVRLEES